MVVGAIVCYADGIAGLVNCEFYSADDRLYSNILLKIVFMKEK